MHFAATLLQSTSNSAIVLNRCFEFKCVDNRALHPTFQSETCTKHQSNFESPNDHSGTLKTLHGPPFNWQLHFERSWSKLEGLLLMFMVSSKSTWWHSNQQAGREAKIQTNQMEKWKNLSKICSHPIPSALLKKMKRNKIWWNETIIFIIHRSLCWRKERWKKWFAPKLLKSDGGQKGVRDWQENDEKDKTESPLFDRASILVAVRCVVAVFWHVNDADADVDVDVDDKTCAGK